MLGSKFARAVRTLTRWTATDPAFGRKQPIEFAFVSEEAVGRALREALERPSYLPGELLLDPAWVMLLELLQAELQGRLVSLSRLRAIAGVPCSVADRWVAVLERKAFVVRRTNSLYREEDSIELSPTGSTAMRRYFNEVVLQAGPRGSAGNAPC